MQTTVGTPGRYAGDNQAARVVTATALIVAMCGIVSVSNAKAQGVVTSESHWTVELKAWIPFDEVVDPLHPFGSSWEAGHGSQPSCFRPPHDAKGHATKTYRGDNHVGYSGSSRVRVWAQFFEKTLLSTDPNTGETRRTYLAGMEGQGESYGESHHDEVFHWHGESRTCELAQRRATEETSVQPILREKGRLAGQLVHIKMRIHSGLPFIPEKLEPAIDASVGIGLSYGPGQEGLSEVRLVYRTDRFPSYGLRVTENGQLAAPVVNDASCVHPIFGLRGAAKIFRGLLSKSNGGKISVLSSPPDPGPLFVGIPPVTWTDGVQSKAIASNARAPSGLCTGESTSMFR